MREAFGLTITRATIGPQAVGKHAGLVALFMQATAFAAGVHGALAVFAEDQARCAIGVKEVQRLRMAAVDALGQGLALGAALNRASMTDSPSMVGELG